MAKQTIDYTYSWMTCACGQEFQVLTKDKSKADLEATEAAVEKHHGKGCPAFAPGTTEDVTPVVDPIIPADPVQG